MHSKILFIPFFLWMIISSSSAIAQNSTVKKKSSSVKSIWEIPHKTLYEKWMWIHRSTAYLIIKERPVDYDTAYIKSYSKRLVLALPVSSRFLKFSLLDTKSGNKLTFVPNPTYNVRVNVSSRWATFIVNTGVTLFNDDSGEKGETKYHDFQVYFYGRNITTDMLVQSYSGYYIRNTNNYNNFISNNPYSVRDDINAFNIEVSSNYIVNHSKFSYRNSFGFVEKQKKSAGSLLFGIYYSFFEARGNPSLINDPFRSSFDTLSFIQKGQTHNFGLNMGYIYTQVFLKKCYATASLVQGFGGEQVVYQRDNNSEFRQLIAGTGKINVRFALGYDNGRSIIGSMVMFDYFYSGKKINPAFNYSCGQFMVYAGYRFSILKQERKLLRKLKLIDY